MELIFLALLYAAVVNALPKEEDRKRQHRIQNLIPLHGDWKTSHTDSYGTVWVDNEDVY